MRDPRILFIDIKVGSDKERQREDTESEIMRYWSGDQTKRIKRSGSKDYVCVCERERERERGGGGAREAEIRKKRNQEEGAKKETYKEGGKGYKE